MEHSKAWCSVASTCSASSRTRRFSTSSSNLRSRTWETKAEENLQTETLFLQNLRMAVGEQGMARWWERSPPTNVARVQIPASTGNGTCGLSLLLVLSFAPRGFSPGTQVFPSPQKPTFPNSNSFRNRVDEEPLCGCATTKLLLLLLVCGKHASVLRTGRRLRYLK